MNNESPAELIRMTAGGFAILPDTSVLEQIARTIKETVQKRCLAEDALKTEIAAAEAENERLSTELNEANRPGPEIYDLLGVEKSKQDPENDDVLRLFRAKLLVLDNDKIALAKQLTELQSIVNQLKQSQLQLQRRQDELKRAKDDAVQSNVAEHYNSTSMKIALYKKLGIHIESVNLGADGSYVDKILVIDKLNDSASVLAVDQKYSEYFISNYIWDRIGIEIE